MVEKLITALRTIGWKISPSKYIVISLAVSAVLSFFFLSFASPTTVLAIFVLSFLTLFLLPVYIAERKAKRAEAEIPWAALSIAASIDAGMSLDEALAVFPKSALGELFSSALELYRRGIPLDRALKKACEDFPSERVKKLFMHLAALYAIGRDTDVLYKIADESLRIQQVEARRVSSQIVITTLAFLAVSSLIPALFEIYVSVGSFMMDVPFSPSQVFTTIAVFFPLFTLVTLLWAYTRLPEVV